ncbi:MAG: monofunctional biosynthetic peptidoglycan transglycosylase [Acidobacteria bacterium]|nr:monofunctional biosynthetic peptidoglycan transglycosylase [Acidobacteriota bacterium]MCI0721127.1 monofunctional biosynthetic peptidoglycan transglycosylase [Acidobacteriota bacterium]
MKKLLLASGILLVCFAAYEYFTQPDVSNLKKETPRFTAFMRQRENEAKASGRKARRYQLWVPHTAISTQLKSAVLIGEDDAFYQHEGYDLDQIKDSFVRNWEKKSFVRGGSTITQQLAKNLYLSTSKNPLRKLREFLIARRMEQELSKRRILELYLNLIEWGDGIYGAEAASRSYFGKAARDLSVREAVLLAAVIPNPRRMNPARPSRRVEYRFNLILSRMYQYRHLSDEEFEAARKSPEIAEPQTVVEQK